MPTTPAQAFEADGLAREGVVRWGTKPVSSSPGVYVVSLTEAPDSTEGSLPEPPLSVTQFEEWLRVRPELTLDGTRPAVQSLMECVRRFWLGDEVILYIGLATSLSKRVGQYYSTPIGARKPHSGGYFLKLLSNLDQLWVHYAPCVDPEGAEHRMLERFCENVPADAKKTLLDPVHPFPFANLEWPRGVRKSHGLRGAREPRMKNLGRA